jgi:hypothetical protein
MNVLLHLSGSAVNFVPNSGFVYAPHVQRMNRKHNFSLMRTDVWSMIKQCQAFISASTGQEYADLIVK